MIEWIRFIDSAGYLSIDDFLKLPNQLVRYVQAVRAADAIRDLKEEISNLTPKDTKTRRKLRDKINELDKTFV